MKKDYPFLASDGEILRISTYFYEDLFTGKTIIFVHGFKGFKDWGFGPFLAEYFAKCGFFVLTFNFSHNGIGDKYSEFTELEKFSRNTYTREIAELNEIISAVRNNYFEFASKSPIGLIGHSRGGAIALITASGRDDIGAVATWASVSNLDRYSARQKQEWRKNGYLEVLNTRTNQKMRLNDALLDDIELNRAGILNMEKAVSNLHCPLLIAHGDQDLAVPISEAEQIYEWADKSKTELFKIFGTGHTFDIVHPFAGSGEKFERLLQKTSGFFNKYLM